MNQEEEDVQFSIHLLAQGFKTWHRYALDGKLARVKDKNKLSLPCHLRILHLGSLCPLSRLIGVGKFSTVYAQDNFAFKHTRIQHGKIEKLRIALKEHLLLHTLPFPHIVQSIQSQMLMEHGTIVKIIHKLPLGTSLTEYKIPDFKMKWNLWKDITIGLAHMHSAGYIHGDLKPDNILLMGTKAHLADFGLCVRIHQPGCEVPKGTPPFSKTIAADSMPSIQLDLWALGCIVLFTLDSKLLENVTTWRTRLLPIIANEIQDDQLSIMELLDACFKNTSTAISILQHVFSIEFVPLEQKVKMDSSSKILQTWQKQTLDFIWLNQYCNEPEFEAAIFHVFNLLQ